MMTDLELWRQGQEGLDENEKITMAKSYVLALMGAYLICSQS